MAIIGTIRKHAGLAVALIGIAIIGSEVEDKALLLSLSLTVNPFRMTSSACKWIS